MKRWRKRIRVTAGSAGSAALLLLICLSGGQAATEAVPSVARSDALPAALGGGGARVACGVVK